MKSTSIKKQALRFASKASGVGALLFTLSGTVAQASCHCIALAPSQTQLVLQKVASFCGAEQNDALRKLDQASSFFAKQYVEICQSAAFAGDGCVAAHKFASQIVLDDAGEFLYFDGC